MLAEWRYYRERAVLMQAIILQHDLDAEAEVNDADREDYPEQTSKETWA